MTDDDAALIAKARTLALSGEGSPDDLGGDIVTMTLRNPDGPELLEIVQALADRLEALASPLVKLDDALTCGDEDDDNAHYCPNCDNSLYDAREMIRTVLKGGE